MSLRNARVLVVGMGGLGAPLCLALGRAGVGTLGLVDDDAVERSNLHRQILFRDGDVGTSKIAAGQRALSELFPDLRFEAHETRLLPDNAVELVSRYDLVVEGSDNFATKFLTADACAIAARPVVHGAAVRWVGTALAVPPSGGPCYRCLFEDLPRDHVPNCAEAGVMGPVVGLAGALQADLALRWLEGAREVAGELVTVDGRAEPSRMVRRRRIPRRSDCSLCGVLGDSKSNITAIDRGRYIMADACLEG
ncbi:HesA/MoeB/ThiF family protein [Pendulispora albinea]|uniref:HesA/MoeB/ThiF family protein n=1 Tax=Pendulispora albinea TaxID=2741071 RepID=A0ABZ2M5Y0_9BACT